MIQFARPLSTAALFSIFPALSAFPAQAQTGAFEEPAKPSYTTAYVSMVGGAALTVFSFVIAEQADQVYQDYRNGEDPDQIHSDYNRAVTLDRISAASLIIGQSALVLGIYWRFIKRTPTQLPSGNETQDSLSSLYQKPPERSAFSFWADPVRVRAGIRFEF